MEVIHHDIRMSWDGEWSLDHQAIHAINMNNSKEEKQ